MPTHSRIARPVHVTVLAAVLGLAAAVGARAHKEPAPMQLGNFSVSLAVKDLAASRAFYETLGFTAVGGNPEHNWIILRNGSTKIGLFQGMFEDNIMTFNPGWDDDGNPIGSFQDVRDIQARLKDAGVPLLMEADPASDGPAHIVFQDPDGNQIMLDQHVAKPGS